MKKIICILAALLTFSAVGFASPLTDYSEGKVGFDYIYRPNLDLSGQGEITYNNIPFATPSSGSASLSSSFDGKANLDMGLTVGIGNNLAIQYRQYNPEGTVGNYTYSNGNNNVNIGIDGKIRSEEFNVLYKLSPNTSAFVGVVRASAGLTPSAGGTINGSAASISIPELRSGDKNMVQVGLLGVAPVGKNLNAYGLVSYADDCRNWEAGLSYDITKRLQFDVNYRYTKYNRFAYANASYGASSANIDLKDIEAKGWGFGLTYKF